VLNRHATQAPNLRAPRRAQSVRAIAFGASTGGLQSLTTILRALAGRRLGAPLFVALHTPGRFCDAVANALRRESGREVIAPRSVASLTADAIYLAAPDTHLRVSRRLGLPQAESAPATPRDSHRPSVDILFASAAEVYGPSLLALVLTGMGEDGLAGARAVVARGGRVLTQSPQTCAAESMPLSMTAAGLSRASMSPEELAASILIRVEAVHV
jgi:two-component system chemotaxis response regulator CheB